MMSGRHSTPQAGLTVIAPPIRSAVGQNAAIDRDSQRHPLASDGRNTQKSTCSRL